MERSCLLPSAALAAAFLAILQPVKSAAEDFDNSLSLYNRSIKSVDADVVVARFNFSNCCMYRSSGIYQIDAEQRDSDSEFNFDFDTSFTTSIGVSRANIDNPEPHLLVTYWALSPDGCSVIGVPNVKVSREPAHGSVRIVQPSPIDAECKDRPIMLEGSAVQYTPDIGFVGTDSFLLTVATPPYWVPEPRQIKVRLFRWEG